MGAACKDGDLWYATCTTCFVAIGIANKSSGATWCSERCFREQPVRKFPARESEWDVLAVHGRGTQDTGKMYGTAHSNVDRTLKLLRRLDADDPSSTPPAAT
jgi:hypothetical protein